MTLWVYWCLTVFRQTKTYHQLQFLLFPPSPSHTTWDSLEYALGVFTCLQAEHLHHNFTLPGAKFYSFISSCSSSYLSISFVCIHTAYAILHLIKSECNIKTQPKTCLFCLLWSDVKLIHSIPLFSFIATSSTTHCKKINKKKCHNVWLLNAKWYLLRSCPLF